MSPCSFSDMNHRCTILTKKFYLMLGAQLKSCGNLINLQQKNRPNINRPKLNIFKGMFQILEHCFKNYYLL